MEPPNGQPKAIAQVAIDWRLPTEGGEKLWVNAG